MEDEDIRKLIADRKIVADQLGLSALVHRIYNYLHQYPATKDVPAFFSRPVEHKEGKSSITRVTISGRAYAFHFTDTDHGHDGSSSDDVVHAEIALYQQEVKVFACNLSQDLADEFSYWKPGRATAFIDGNWEEDLQRVRELVREEEKQASARGAESAKRRLEEEARRFGIDVENLKPSRASAGSEERTEVDRHDVHSRRRGRIVGIILWGMIVLFVIYVLWT